MRIKEIQLYPIALRLKETFKIANVTMHDVRLVISKLTTDEGIVGFGEATPAWEVTGETQTTVIDIVDYLSPLLIGKRIDSFEEVKACIELMNPSGSPQIVWGAPSAKACLEIAMLDAYGKLVKKPIYEILGGENRTLKSSGVIGIKEPDETVSSVGDAIEKGAERIKLKCGIDAERDFATVKKIRESFPDNPLVLDANQGYINAERAITFARKVEKYHIDWFEQPILADDILGLVKLRKEIGIPVMADEAVHNIFDVELLLELGAVDYINIKLMKCGGILEAVKIAELCQRYNVPCQMGSMLESAVGTAAGAHAVLAHKNIRTNELGGVNTPETPFAVGIEGTPLQFRLSGKPGLGVDLSDAKLRRCKG